jgi:exosome complex component MTR3
MEKQFLISTGITKNAAGSAYVELGNMKITCSVHGPRDNFLSDTYKSKGELFVDFKFAPFCNKDKYRLMTQVGCFTLSILLTG